MELTCYEVSDIVTPHWKWTKQFKGTLVQINGSKIKLSKPCELWSLDSFDIIRAAPILWVPDGGVDNI